MTYDQEAPAGDVARISHESHWDRCGRFVKEIMPVVEEAGVAVVAHPNDPPLEYLRGKPRLVYRQHLYQTLLDLQSSPSNQLEFCIGALAEVADDDLYGSQNKVAYVHPRNVPNYVESFIDAGDVNIGKVRKIPSANKYDGVIVPEYAPQMPCRAPWHCLCDGLYQGKDGRHFSTLISVIKTSKDIVCKAG